MTQDEAIIKQKVSSIKSKIKLVNGDINTIEKCINIGKNFKFTDIELKPWTDKRNELMSYHSHLQGELKDIHNECEHDFSMVGTWESLFGTEAIYECKKCGFQKTGEI